MPFTFTMESRYKSPFKSNIPTLFIVFRNESYNACIKTKVKEPLEIMGFLGFTLWFLLSGAFCSGL